MTYCPISSIFLTMRMPFVSLNETFRKSVGDLFNQKSILANGYSDHNKDLLPEKKLRDQQRVFSPVISRALEKFSGVSPA